MNMTLLASSSNKHTVLIQVTSCPFATTNSQEGQAQDKTQ